MNMLFTICGRAGSKGIKNKNIKQFCGIPLPYYTISAIDLFLKNTRLDINIDIAVSTDSKELIELMLSNSLQEVDVIKRDENLCGDIIGKIAVIEDCMNKMQERKKKKYDIVVDMDITSPLRRVADIERVITRHLNTKADVTTTVATARRNPYFNQVKKVEHGYKKVIDSNFTARQQAPEIFDMNASIYAYSPDYLKLGKGVLDGYCECVEMYDTGILDLDHEGDFLLMQVIAEYLFENNEEFGIIRNNIKRFERETD